MEGQTEVALPYDRATGDHNQSLSKIVKQTDQNNNQGIGEHLPQDSEGSYYNRNVINKNLDVKRYDPHHQGNFSDNYSNPTPIPYDYQQLNPHLYPYLSHMSSAIPMTDPRGDYSNYGYPSNNGNLGNQQYPNNQLQTCITENDNGLKNQNTDDDYRVIHVDFQPLQGPPPVMDIHSIYDEFIKFGKILRIIKYRPNKKRDLKSNKDPHHALIEFENPLDARSAVTDKNGKIFKGGDQIAPENKVSMRIEKSAKYPNTKLEFSKGQREENCWDYEKQSRPTKDPDQIKARRNMNNRLPHQGHRVSPNDPLGGQPTQLWYRSLYPNLQGAYLHPAFPNCNPNMAIQSPPGTWLMPDPNYYYNCGPFRFPNSTSINDQKVIEVGPLNVNHPRFKDHVKDDLFKLFGHYGDIKHLKLEYTRSLEYALIEYVHERNGADNAIFCLHKVRFYERELEVKKSRFSEVKTNQQSREPYNINNDVKAKVKNGDLSKSFKDGYDVHRYKNEKSFNHRNTENEVNSRLDLTPNHGNQKIKPNRIMHISNIPEDFTKEELFCPSDQHNDDLPTFDKEGAKQLKSDYETYGIIDKTHTFEKNFKWHSYGKDGYGPGGPAQNVMTSRPDDQKVEKKKLKMAYVNLKSIEDAVMFLCLTHNFQVREKRHLRISFCKKSTDWDKIPKEAESALIAPEK